MDPIVITFVIILSILMLMLVIAIIIALRNYYSKSPTTTPSGTSGTPSGTSGTPSGTSGTPSGTPTPTPAQSGTPTPTTTPTPSGTPTPTAPFVASKWAPIKSKLANENNNQWSYRIYNAMTDDAALTEDPYAGGINYNVEHCGLTQRNTLTKTMANCLCINPCYWYDGKYGKGAAMKMAGLCDCDAKTAINF